MSNKLKPCPFCGGEAVLMKVTFTAGMSCYVRCGNRKCAVFPITKSYSTDDEAIEVWNRRANDERRTGMIAKLKYYRSAIKWLWEHRAEPNNRAKWRRMMREVER